MVFLVKDLLNSLLFWLLLLVREYQVCCFKMSDIGAERMAGLYKKPTLANHKFQLNRPHSPCSLPYRIRAFSHQSTSPHAQVLLLPFLMNGYDLKQEGFMLAVLN